MSYDKAMQIIEQVNLGQKDEQEFRRVLNMPSSVSLLMTGDELTASGLAAASASIVVKQHVFPLTEEAESAIEWLEEYQQRCLQLLIEHGEDGPLDLAPIVDDEDDEEEPVEEALPEPSYHDYIKPHPADFRFKSPEDRLLFALQFLPASLSRSATEHALLGLSLNFNDTQERHRWAQAMVSFVNDVNLGKIKAEPIDDMDALIERITIWSLI